MNQAAAASVIIMAGGKTDPTAARGGVAHRGLLVVQGQTIISRLIAACQGAGVGQIIAVGTPEILATLPDGVEGLAAPGAAAANIAAGLARADREWVIIATADLPWLTAAGVARFITTAQACGADMVYPIVSQQDYNRRFPGGRRTYVTLREGTFTGGNLILLRREFLVRLMPLVQRIFDSRKNPLALARLFGLGFILGLLSKRLSIAAVEARASRITGGRTVALPIDLPEIACDIDKPEDLAEICPTMQ